MKILRALVALAAIACGASAQNTLSLAWQSNTSLGSITTSGTNCNTLAACVWIVTPATASGVTAQITGSFTATLQFEVSGDGINWTAASGTSSTSSAGQFAISIAGQFFRVRASSYSSGPISINLLATTGGAALSSYTQVVGLFTGCSSGSPNIRFDGTCGAGGTGSGNVNGSGSSISGNLPVFNNNTASGIIDSLVPVTSVMTLTGTQSASNKTIDSVTPTIFGFLPNITGDVQQQINSLGVSATNPSCGAKGDGVTDDSAAINSCLTANASVFLPPGNYYLKASGITIPSGRKLYGAGTATVISFDSSFSGVRVITNSDIVNGNSNISLSDITLQSPSAVSIGGSNPGVIRMEKVDRLSIERIYTTSTGFQSTFSAIDLAGGDRHAVISGCRITNNNAGLGSGGAVWIRGGSSVDTSYNSYDVTVSNNVLEANADEAAGVYGWFNNVDHVSFSNNTLSNLTSGSELALGILGRNVGGQPGTVTNISALGNVIYGRINISTGADRVNVTGNTIVGASATSISTILSTEYTTGAGMPTHVLIAADLISGGPGTGSYGVFVGASGTTQVVGCQFVLLADSAIYGDADANGNTIDYGSGTSQIAIQADAHANLNHIMGGGIGIFGYALSSVSWTANTVENVSQFGLALNAGGGTVTGEVLQNNIIRNTTGSMTYGINAYNGTFSTSVSNHNAISGAATGAYSLPGFSIDVATSASTAATATALAATPTQCANSGYLVQNGITAAGAPSNCVSVASLGTYSISSTGGMTAPSNAIALDPTQGVDTPAKSLGFVCDGSTDDSSHFNSSTTANKWIHLPDHSTCMGTNLTFYDGAHYQCRGCVIKQIAGSHTNLINMSYSGTIELDGVTFDEAAVQIGSYSANPITITSGGSGYPASSSTNISLSGGGCSTYPWGTASTNSSGVITSISLVSPGTGCTTAFTGVTLNFSTGSGATFTFAAPNNSTTPTYPYIAQIFNSNFTCRNCTLTNTGSGTTNLSLYLSGFYFYKGSYLLDNITVASTVGGTQIKDDPGNTTSPRLIRNPTLNGSTQFGIQSLASPGNLEIAGGSITNVTDASNGNGSNGGTAIDVQGSNVRVHDVYVNTTDFSCLRAEGQYAFENYFSRIICKNLGETSVYAELGAYNNYFDHITIDGCDSGFQGTNAGSRPVPAKNYFDHMIVKNCISYGAKVEHDDVTDSDISDVAYGIHVGNGSTTGMAMVIARNSFHSTGTSSYVGQMGAAMMVDYGAGTSITDEVGTLISENQVDTNVAIPIISANNASQTSLSGISNASAAVLTFPSAPSPALAVGQVYLIQDELQSGMWQINGQICQVTAVTTTTATCGNLNSASWGTYVSWAARVALLSTSSTTPYTPYYAWPSSVGLRWGSNSYTVTASTTPVVDWSRGSTQKLTLSANASPSFTSIGCGMQVTFVVIPSTYTLTWPSNVKTAGYSLTASKTNIVSMTSFDGTNLVITGISAY